MGWRLLLTTVLLLLLRETGSAAVWNNESILGEIAIVRNSLLEREIQTLWLPENQHEAFLNRFQTDGETGIDDSLFTDPPREARFSRFSEWPGHWLGFAEVLGNEELMCRISDLAATLGHMEVDKSSVMKIIDLQHDFLEIYELLNDWSPSESYDKARRDKLCEDVKLILRSLLLPKQQTQEFNHVFNPADFRGERTNGTKVYKIETKVLQHDKVSKFRVRSEIYLVEGGNTPFKEWMSRGQMAAEPESVATLILAEYPLCFFEDGDAEYLPIPKTIRFEEIEFVSSRIRTRSFGVYRFTGARKGDLPSYHRLDEESGGTPLQDLPNVSNGRRTQLSVSCINCHGGMMMLSTKRPRTVHEVKDGKRDLFTTKTVAAELEAKMKMPNTEKLREFLKSSR